MKQNQSIISFLLLLVIAVYSCTSSKQTQSDTREEVGADAPVIVPDTFVLPQIPESITNADERAQYLVMHFWDRFDFTNRKLIELPDITEQAFVDYINLLNYAPAAVINQSIHYTLNAAKADEGVYRYFTALFEKYYYDPNSPFRNDEHYLTVLKEVVQVPFLADELRSRYKFQLALLMKNRVGEKATNFTYTVASGQSNTLFNLKSEFTLVIFSNPGCSTCEAVISRLNQSKELNEALSLNSRSRTMLAILTLYPDDDLEEWKAHLPSMPERWIHAYDKEKAVIQQNLYDIKAYPTLYLLDKEKNVLLKDSSIEAIESFFSVSR